MIDNNALLQPTVTLDAEKCEYRTLNREILGTMPDNITTSWIPQDTQEAKVGIPDYTIHVRF